MSWNFDNSYARELEGYYAPWQLDPPPRPALLLWNDALAAQLGLPETDDATRAAIASGAELPAGAEPIALAYAGHQFGQFSPQLGDGRALLLGEIVAPDGKRFDLQLKGSGATPFSRQGDGKSALGPALREYLISEAMAALGIATTRSLAVALTGETVVRQAAHPGAVLTRTAASHIRVGTFEFVAAHLGTDKVRQLADYAIARHYPALAEAPNPYLALLEAVMDAQIALIASWMQIGFVHGVMNTDNVAISGETIDYGPCAFIDIYAAGAVFSSIDRHGRYAFANQPRIGQWNIAQFGNALAGVIAEDDDDGLDKANALLAQFPERYTEASLAGMRAKLGLTEARDGDAELVRALFAAMEGQQVDFTNFFRLLGTVPADGAAGVTELFADPQAIAPWLDDWLARIEQESVSAETRRKRMDAVNPLYIPRNHKVEEALAAAEDGDMQPFATLLEVVTHPYEAREEWSGYAQPAPESFGDYVTFCGT